MDTLFLCIDILYHRDYNVVQMSKLDEVIKFRLTNECKQSLLIHAERRKLKLSQLIRMIVADWLCANSVEALLNGDNVVQRDGYLTGERWIRSE